jgi:Leucine-rich repeat (LRR) protein
VPMQGRPYNSGPLRSMQSELAYPTFMIAANQRLGPPELVAVTSIEIMPQPLTNPRAIQGADVLYPKKVTPTTTWRERPVPAMVCLGMFCCAGFILLVVGVSVVVASRHETPLTSATPTATPTGVGDLLLKDLMSISDSDALLNPESPQHRAGYWLTQMDKLNQDFDLTQLLQRYALVVVYHALTENGANVALNGWLDAGRHECEWGTAIVCGSGSSGLSAKKVVALDLSRLELKGTIPDEIRFLDRLESLQMNNNAIRGTIPPVLGLFSNLQQLDLERNAFTGEIPSVIGGMTSLTHIDLSHNFLNNSLDDGFFKLVALRYVDLSYNRLSGLFTRFANLTFLSTLDVRMNKFSGTFPAHMDQLSELAVLNIDYNEISGTFPPNYAFVGKRVELTASNNLLTGTIPSEAPSELQKEATDEFLAGEWILKKLDIGGNIFSGLVPRLLEVLPNLKHVDIKNNMFVGPAPGFSRSQLDYLSVASNLLTGTMPATVGDSLKHMDYSRNRMSGSLPSELGSLTQLEYLDLGNNPFLNGTLATELGELRNVQYIDISNCCLTGTLPTSLQKLSKLVNLTLAGNGLTGPIPPDFQNLSSLKHMALNNNSLSSEIPTTLGKLVDLESVDLSGNNLVGHIPDELTNLGRLVKLFVDHNLLTGNVPVGFCNMLGSPYTNFKDLLIDCEVSCPCCSSQNFGDIDCGSVSVQRGVWHGLF